MAAGREGGSRPRKTLPRVDPEEALSAFAESVGMPIEMIWEGVVWGDGGEVVEIECCYEDLEGTLPVVDMHMPHLRDLVLYGYRDSKGGEARGR